MTSAGWLSSEPLERSATVGRHRHDVSLSFQVVTDGVGERLLVLDDQDALTLVGHRVFMPPPGGTRR